MFSYLECKEFAKGLAGEATVVKLGGEALVLRDEKQGFGWSRITALAFLFTAGGYSGSIGDEIDVFLEVDFVGAIQELFLCKLIVEDVNFNAEGWTVDATGDWFVRSHGCDCQEGQELSLDVAPGSQARIKLTIDDEEFEQSERNLNGYLMVCEGITVE